MGEARAVGVPRLGEERTLLELAGDRAGELGPSPFSIAIRSASLASNSAASGSFGSPFAAVISWLVLRII